MGMLLAVCQFDVKKNENRFEERQECDKPFSCSLSHLFSLEMSPRLFNCYSSGSCSTLFDHPCHPSLHFSFEL